MASLFKKAINELKGIGTHRGSLLKKLGISTIGDLIRFYPRTHEDWGNPYLIMQAPLGKDCCVSARVCTNVSVSSARGGTTLYKFKICDQTGIMNVTFFNNKFVEKSIFSGNSYIFYGKIKQTFGEREMLAPKFLSAEKEIYIRPIYKQTEGLSSRQIETFVKKALSLLPQTINESLPEPIRKTFDLCGLYFALQNIHFPKDKVSLNEARRRLIFEESLVLQLGIIQNKYVNKSKHLFAQIGDFSEEFVNALDFCLTSAQMRCIGECIRDMQNPYGAMSRLLQGDVGSGKTVVAAALCYCVAKSGLQVAFMAPTEILAQQHYKTFVKLFRRLQSVCQETSIDIGLLTSSTGKKARREILYSLECGTLDIIIGTHSLLSESVLFKNLGLVITDEQQRFGVFQRASLAAKGNNPHVLVMSATPIPRTLALIIYGDLDISVLDELPPGRKKIETYCINTKKRSRLFGFLKKLLDEQKQGYIVCPLIEEGEIPLVAAKEYFKKLKKEDFAEYCVELLHGKMKTNEKAAIMERFVCGEISVLVSTTVIEVGVDVPNAVFMVIESAERFGLSQLHQLRGRVGRGSEKAYCILVSEARNKKSLQRLEILTKTNDGFKIADEDLKIRGPGEFFGARQHGLPELKIAKFSEDMQIFWQTKKLAKKILERDPELYLPEHRFLKAQKEFLFQKNFLCGCYNQ